MSALASNIGHLPSRQSVPLFVRKPEVITASDLVCFTLNERTFLSRPGTSEKGPSADQEHWALDAGLGQTRLVGCDFGTEAKISQGAARALNAGTSAFGATAAGFCGGGCDRIEGQRLGSDAITSPASASSRQGETVNGSKSAHWVTQRYMAFGSLDSEIANP